MTRLVGRKEELRELQRLFESDRAEFLAIYGRRRVGKTFLISEFFSNQGAIYFELTGSSGASKAEQLANFHREYCALFERERPLDPPKNWSEAFDRLAEICRRFSEARRVILFFDELPWLASPNSGFIRALEYFWNRHGSRFNNLLLIVCGSAAYWMINKVINSRAGLYGRLSADLRLMPFNLYETELFLKSRSIELPRKQICELYMAIGGIPKYLSYIPKGLSLPQIVDRLCFTPRAPLLKEYHRIFVSLFDQPSLHSDLIQALASSRRDGLYRSELIEAIPALKGGGSTSRILEELEECGFIGVTPGYQKQTKDQLYRLIDEYSLFYFRWIEPYKSQILQGMRQNEWQKSYGTPAWLAWAGKAFESLCLKHMPQIKRALEIGGVETSAFHWVYRATNEKGAEIDLVIDRADNCINLCEIKFSNSEFVLTKEYAAELERKKELFRQRTGSKKALLTTLITPYGFESSALARATIETSIILESLFADG